MGKKKKAKAFKQNELDQIQDLQLDTSHQRPILHAQEMKGILDEDEYKLYSELQYDINPQTEDEMDQIIERLEEVHFTRHDSLVHSEPEPDHKELLQNELNYICTIISVSERKELLAELYYSLRAGLSISHLDLSDIITACLKPTLARSALVKADANHKYSTAQYMQVYHFLRVAQRQYALIFARAMIDGLRAGADTIYWSNKRFGK